MALSPQRIASFIKWQLTPVRYLGRVRYIRPRHLAPAPAPRTELAIEITKTGYATGPVYDGERLKALQDRFLPRRPDTKPANLKAPFVNLSKSEDFSEDSPLMQMAFSREVLDVAIDYFGKRLRLDSLQVLYSFAQDGELKESQKWHLDYGDAKSLHCVMYLNDVKTYDDGPFVFIDKEASKRVGRGLIVRRIPDEQMTKESGNAPLQTVYGDAGSSVWIDPAACYHYGSRCQNPRTAVFVTFNSETPFVAPMPLVVENAEKIAAVGKKLRPDLDPSVIDRMLGL